MKRRSSARLGSLLLLSFCGAAATAACGSSHQSSTNAGFTMSNSSSSGSGHGGAGGSIGVGTANGGGAGIGGSFAGVGGANTQGLVVQPAGLQTITITPGQTTLTPPLTYTATFDGQPTNVTWSVDRGDAATVTNGTTTSTTFEPTGNVGGLVNVLAVQGSTTIKRQVLLKLAAPLQNGANGSTAEAGQIAGSPSDLTAGGGVGGVGGEGLGPAPTNFPTTTMPGSALGLVFLYPYDKTVWPRGLPAPLLQWASASGDAGASTLVGADAIQIDVSTTSGSFSWSGRFAPPAVLTAAGLQFTRSPIPQDVWAMATNTAGGTTSTGAPDQLIVSLTIAKGGVAYGPITETWTIAPGNLAGTVYYNSYGTSLVKNSTDNDKNGNQYGAAVLSFPAGAIAPTVAVGSPSGYDGSGCRVCHVVSGDGSTLIAQHGDNYALTSSYDLKNANAESVQNGYSFGWAGLSTDGTLAMTNGAQLAAGQPNPNALYPFPPNGAQALNAPGLPADLVVGAPAFSTDGKHVAFEFLGGTLGSIIGALTPSQIVSLDFDQTTMSFTNPKLLATMPGGSTGAGNGGKNAGFPAFMPTNDAIVFHNQISNPAQSHRYNTWLGAQGQVWWSDLATGTATPLAALNGFDLATNASYLPTGPTNHATDTLLNYEPTVAPLVTGGYAWVIFTSRRLYGSVATTDPWQSDPRSYDNTQYANVTTKKLWVAAVDIGSIKNGTFVQGFTPGTDPSHPAFYLPAQEIVAGNARAFWVLDPCRADGSTCATGDQCCGGFCEPNGDGGALVCGAPASGCSGLQDKCSTATDCCDPTALCINGFCSMPTAQ